MSCTSVTCHSYFSSINVFDSMCSTGCYFEQNKMQPAVCTSDRVFGYEHSISDTFDNSGEDNSQDDILDIIVLPDGGETQCLQENIPEPSILNNCELA